MKRKIFETFSPDENANASKQKQNHKQAHNGFFKRYSRKYMQMTVRNPYSSNRRENGPREFFLPQQIWFNDL